MPTRCLSVAQVAELLVCSEDHVTDLLRTGDLVGAKIGGNGRGRRWAITEADYEAFVAARRQVAA